MTSLYDFEAATITGKTVSLSKYSDKVVLVVNTASKCVYTPQFSGLQGLYEEFGPNDFVVLGFPCGQFANQEFENPDQIAYFCQTNYRVNFPMFAKIEVNGQNAHPLYQWLKSEKPGVLGGVIKWNFTKFLIGKDGQVIRRYAPAVDPASLRDDIRQALTT